VLARPEPLEDELEPDDRTLPLRELLREGALRTLRELLREGALRTLRELLREGALRTLRELGDEYEGEGRPAGCD
jgi:hypothetical protein